MGMPISACRAEEQADVVGCRGTVTGGSPQAEGCQGPGRVGHAIQGVLDSLSRQLVA
jgi:hypothetical protein